MIQDATMLMITRDLARRCAWRSQGHGPMVVWWCPARASFRWAGTEGRTAERLQRMEATGQLVRLGCYGPPWDWDKPVGITRVRQIQEWILDDLQAVLSDEDQSTDRN